MPISAIAAITDGTAIQNGQPSAASSARPTKEPSIIRSPCAKLTVSVAL